MDQFARYNWGHGFKYFNCTNKLFLLLGCTSPHPPYGAKPYVRFEASWNFGALSISPKNSVQLVKMQMGRSDPLEISQNKRTTFLGTPLFQLEESLKSLWRVSNLPSETCGFSLVLLRYAKTKSAGHTQPHSGFGSYGRAVGWSQVENGTPLLSFVLLVATEQESLTITSCLITLKDSCLSVRRLFVERVDTFRMPLLHRGRKAPPPSENPSPVCLSSFYTASPAVAAHSEGALWRPPQKLYQECTRFSSRALQL